MSAGMKTYVRELVERLPRIAPDLRFAVFTNHSYGVDASNVMEMLVPQWVAVNGAIGEQFVYPQLLGRIRADLIHYMSVYAPRISPEPHVYTVHDCIHLRYPSYFSWKVPPYYRLVVGPVARSAKAVITDAAATVPDLVEFLSVDASKARVVPLGVSSEFMLDDRARARLSIVARERFSLPRPYLLYAGNRRPHKNLRTLFDAWAGLGGLPCDLVLTGDEPLDHDLARLQPPNGKLHLVGELEQSELISLYAGCAAMVQPSLYEGFGLAVLEAMASGAPAIVAKTPAMLEVGGDAVASFAPVDAQELRALLTTVLSDPREGERLRVAGRARVKAFSWDATAAATAQVYREELA
jgi:glycosyltransferase involved in cell wall biosynthesis